MTVEFYWRIPHSGDGKLVKGRQGTRGEWGRGEKTPLALNAQYGEAGHHGNNYIDYLVAVAQAADINGFRGALVPSFRQSEDPWVLCGALARETRHLRFMVAFQPAFFTPSYLAQASATLQRVSHGRLDLNVITGGGGPEQRAYGDYQDHDSRYDRTDEFLDVYKQYWKGGPFDYKGNLFQFEDGGLREPLRDAPLPGIYFAGSSDPALVVAAKHSDVYLSWAETLGGVREKIDRVRAEADKIGRADAIRFGVRIDLYGRETEDLARADLRRYFDAVTSDPKFNEQRQARRGGPGRESESVGRKRQNALSSGNSNSFEDLFIAPNLWAGAAFAGTGPVPLLVGSYQQVAERLAEYVDIGVTTFILSAKPHLEEAYRVGEEILPLVEPAIHRERSVSRAG
jgi:alkanesulfonate monooxygenase